MINPSGVPEQSPHVRTTTDDAAITRTWRSTSCLIGSANRVFRVVAACTCVLGYTEVSVWRAALGGCCRKRVAVAAALDVRVVGERYEGIGGEEPSLSRNNVGNASFVVVRREGRANLFTVLACGFVRTVTVC